MISNPKQKTNHEQTKRNGKPRAMPLSLYPLSVDEIVAAMLQTPPMPKDNRKRPKRTRKQKNEPPKKQTA